MAKKRGFTPEEFAELISVGHCTVYRWIYKDLIPYVDKRVPTSFGNKIKRLWKKTCTSAEAARILEVTTSKIDDMLRDGEFRTIRIISKKRIFLNSLKGKRKSFVVQKKDILYPKRRGFARLTKTKKLEISRMGNNSKRKREVLVEAPVW